MARRRFRHLGIAAVVILIIFVQLLRKGGEGGFTLEKLFPRFHHHNTGAAPTAFRVQSEPLHDVQKPLHDVPARPHISDPPQIEREQSLSKHQDEKTRPTHEKDDGWHDNTTLAITTTVLNPPPTFRIWLDYHLERVDLILIFMDDPSERPRFEKVVKDKRVILFDGSNASPELMPSSRLIIRQDKNNQAAIDYALAHNITWLMHIDIDELLYDEGNHSWRHLDGVGQVTFRNHEAVPVAHKVVNYFAECTLFKTNSGALDFMAYGNGKSAVRLKEGVETWGPHQFMGYEGEHRTVDEPVILHYPTPSFDSWIAKYKLYGKFSDFWFDDPEQHNDVSFMLKSRDQLQKALETGDWEEARKFFAALIPDEETIQRYIKSGDLKRFYPLGEHKRENGGERTLT